MTKNALWLKIDGAQQVQALQEALQKLDGAGGEAVLDLSAVQRIDAGALRAMDELAAKAGERGVAVALFGVNADVYRVLKLTQLAARFSYEG